MSDPGPAAVKHLVSDSGHHKDNPVERDVCQGLRRTAIRATTQLSNAENRRVPEIISQLLAEIADCVASVDAHLFRVKLDDSGSGAVGLKYHTGAITDESVLKTLGRFQFQLFSSRIQECLVNDQIATIRDTSTGGGRIITGLMRHTQCKSYFLCPIRQDGKLRGILGVARRKNDKPVTPEFFELLRLNGCILLNNALRIRRERVRGKKLTQWRRIANQSCDFALSIDSDLLISNTTPFGASHRTPSLNGLRLIDVVTRNFHGELKKQIHKAVNTGHVRTCDFQLALGHEGPRWYLARIEPSRRQVDSYATLYITDNNPDKVLQEEVRELRDQLVKASRLSLLGQMSTEFAHQLNQPLQAILTYCNIIQRRIAKGSNTEAKTLKALSNIENSVTHSGNIIRRIRDFVKFRLLQTEHVALQELIEQAVLMVLPTARGWNADLISPLDTPETIVVVDKAQTTHVLINLMINALEACCEFGMERPRVELYVREDAVKETVTIAVKDNGPGLPEEDSDIVFHKFYSGKKEGLGMGLTISREVCESQGGSLSARNNDGEAGCTFFVTMSLNQKSGSDTDELEVIPDPENLHE